MEKREIIPAIEAVLFAAGDPVSAKRIALVLDAREEEVLEAAKELSDELSYNRRGIRVVRLGDKLQMCSDAEHSQLIIRALEQRKPPKLSQSALEVLAIVAYFQPVTRAYIDQVRGMDSTYTVGVLCDRGLIEPSGKLEVPGRPTLFSTTDGFLRVIGISGLDELPPLPDITTDEGIVTLQNAIDERMSAELEGQISIEDAN